MTMRLAIFFAVVASIFGGIFGYHALQAFSAGKQAANMSLPPVSVKVSKVKSMVIPDEITAIGSINSLRQVTISPEAAGTIMELYFDSGSVVKKGEALAKLNDDVEQSEMRRLQVQRNLAKLNLNRSIALLNKAVSQSEVDFQQSTLDQIDADIEKTKALISQKLIKAPFSGVLGVRQANLGQYVKVGDAVVTLTDMSALVVDFTLPEHILGSLPAGAPVEIRVDTYPNRSFRAHITAMEPQIQRETRTVKVQSRLEETASALTPGMFAHAVVTLSKEMKGLVLPTSCVDYSIQGESVFVVKTSVDQNKREKRLTAVRKLIVTERNSGNYVTVKSGLAEGELVVSSGQINLHEGAQVSIENTDAVADAGRIAN